MTTLINKEMLYIADHISQHLAFRDSADDFFSYFSYISSLEKSDVIIDFSGVESITRSFAHQYLKNKKKIKKQIAGRNIPSNVTRMFELVKSQSSKRVKMDTEPIKVVDVVC